MNKKTMMRILKYLFYTLVLLLVAFFGFYKFWFLRLPDRKIPHDIHVFVSPANGTIVSVSPWNQESLVVTKEQFGAINVWTKDVDTAGYIISIQMDPTNVHYQRAPIDGKFISKVYTKGSFNNAVLMSNDFGIRFENEHNEILLETPRGTKYKVVQIAGFLARRIEDYLQPNQKLQQGDVIGLIKFGSQITVVLPHTAHVQAKKDDVVIDGESVLAVED